MTTKPKEWATDDSTPDPKDIEPLGWRLIVRPLTVKEKTEGGIILIDSVLDTKDLTQTVGRVIAIGPLSYKRADMIDYDPWVKVGDFVVFAKFGGQRMKYGGVKLIVINDDEVTVRVADPDKLER